MLLNAHTYATGAVRASSSILFMRGACPPSYLTPGRNRECDVSRTLRCAFDTRARLYAYGLVFFLYYFCSTNVTLVCTRIKQRGVY